MNSLNFNFSFNFGDLLKQILGLIKRVNFDRLFVSKQIALKKSRKAYKKNKKIKELFSWINEQSKNGKFCGKFKRDLIMDYLSSDEIEYIRSLGFIITNRDGTGRPLTFYYVSWKLRESDDRYDYDRGMNLLHNDD